jgi:endonuclease/exonuclease/phosphatase family metal-dependent hydrolase
MSYLGATMNIKVFAWNLHDGLTDPNVNVDQLENEILREQADIAVFPEARSEIADLADETVNRFEGEGYGLYQTDYDDADSREDRHGLLVLARPELVKSMKTIRLAGRSAIRLSLLHDTSFIGAHFVDRTVRINWGASSGGEEQRVEQAIEAALFSKPKGVIAGDLNATHKKGLTPTVLRVARPLAELLPALDPRPGFDTPKIQRLGSLAQRLTSMSTGKTLQALETDEFIDADPTSQPTMIKGHIKVQLDHIMVRNLAIVEPTKVLSATGLSDHRGIVAKLTL